MKKLLFTVIVSLPALAFAQEGKYTVNGKIGTYNAPAKVYLQHRVNGKNVIDSTTLKDGRFQFSGEAVTPVSAYFCSMIKGTASIISAITASFYLEPGVITVTGDDKAASALVNGPKTNQENENYQAALKPVNDAYEALDVKQKARYPGTATV